MRQENILSNDGRKNYVGRYFIELCQFIFGARNQKFEVLVQNDPDGDLIHWGLDAILEVKAGDNNHCFMIYEDQLERHLQVVEHGFSARNCFYVLFAYKNRASSPKGRRMALLPACRTPTELDVFLAANITTAYVVDARILWRSRQKIGTKKDTRSYMMPRPFVPVSRRFLDRLADNIQGILADMESPDIKFLGSGDRSIVRMRIATEFRSNPTSLVCVPLIPLEKQLLLKDFINGEINRA